MLGGKNIKNKILIIIIVLSFSVILILLGLSKKTDNGVISTKDLKKEMDIVIADKFVNPNITKEELESTVKTPMSNNMYVLGKDSMIMSFPDENLKKKYKLSPYIEKQKQYATKVQKAFSERFSYTLGITEKNGDIKNQHISIITIYYGLYSSDLDILISEVMKIKNYDMSRLEKSELMQMEMYKVKVLAMEVLDKHFDIYKNKDGEVREVVISYEKGIPKTNDEIFSLLCNINGLTYPNVDFSIRENVEKQTIRIAAYLEELKLKL